MIIKIGSAVHRMLESEDMEIALLWVSRNY